MNQTLTLQIPEEMYQPLVEIAQGQGQSPEEFMVQWLKISIQHFTGDPFESSIGSVQSNIPDRREQHDRYLGENLLTDELNSLNPTQTK